MSLQQSTIPYSPQHCIEHYYLCNYRPLHSGTDRLSTSLLRFKAALQYDLQAWIDCAVAELNQLDIPNDVIIIRALASNETGATHEQSIGLHKLGMSVADSLAACWMPWLISKGQKTRPLKYLTATERGNELCNAYQLATYKFDLNDRRILLIDDIFTTGATIVSIVKIIKKYFPGSRIKAFTLAKSGYDDSLNKSILLTGDSYSWHQQAGWIASEEVTSYDHYAQLCKWIMNDDFS